MRRGRPALLGIPPDCVQLIVNYCGNDLEYARVKRDGFREEKLPPARVALDHAKAAGEERARAYIAQLQEPPEEETLARIRENAVWSAQTALPVHVAVERQRLFVLREVCRSLRDCVDALPIAALAERGSFSLYLLHTGHKWLFAFLATGRVLRPTVDERMRLHACAYKTRTHLGLSTSWDYLERLVLRFMERVAQRAETRNELWRALCLVTQHMAPLCDFALSPCESVCFQRAVELIHRRAIDEGRV